MHFIFFLRNTLTGHKMIGWEGYFLQHFKNVIPLPSWCNARLDIRLPCYIILLYGICLFSLATWDFFSLWLVFSNPTRMWLCIVRFFFKPFGYFWALVSDWYFPPYLERVVLWVQRILKSVWRWRRDIVGELKQYVRAKYRYF